VPVMDTQRVHIAGSAPVHGDVLHADGFGRTATTWVPDQLTTATFSVDAVTDTTLTLTGTSTPDASICKGDAGGPAFRYLTANYVELVALHETTWGFGCYASTETRKGNTEARVDNLRPWIQQTTTAPATITGKASGQCLDQDYTNNTPHPGITAFPCWTPPADNQRWTLTWLPAQPDTVTIVDKASGQCLDQDYTSGTPHPGVLAFPCSNAANQQWVIQPRDEGAVSIVNKASGQCLDQDYTNNTPHPGVTAYPCWNGTKPDDNQRWKLN